MNVAPIPFKNKLEKDQLFKSSRFKGLKHDDFS